MLGSKNFVPKKSDMKSLVETNVGFNEYMFKKMSEEIWSTKCSKKNWSKKVGQKKNLVQNKRNRSKKV